MRVRNVIRSRQKSGFKVDLMTARVPAGLSRVRAGKAFKEIVNAAVLLDDDNDMTDRGAAAGKTMLLKTRGLDGRRVSCLSAAANQDSGESRRSYLCKSHRLTFFVGRLERSRLEWATPSTMRCVGLQVR